MRAMRWVLTAGTALLLAASPVHGQADGDEAERDPLYEALDAQCARISRLPTGKEVRDEGFRMLDALDAERDRLESQLDRAWDSLAPSRSRDGQLTPRQIRLSEQIEDLEQELEFVVLSRKVIDICLAERYEELVRLMGVVTESGTLRASWEATCTDTPGIDVAKEGTLELDLKEGGASGIVRWISKPERSEADSEGAEEREITLDVTGTYERDGTLELTLVRPEALDEFGVRGRVGSTLTGLWGSGEIRYGITVEGCNIGPDPDVCVHQVSCSGSWAGQ